MFRLNVRINVRAVQHGVWVIRTNITHTPRGRVRFAFCCRLL